MSEHAGAPPRSRAVALIRVERGVIAEVAKIGPTPPDGLYAIVPTCGAPFTYDVGGPWGSRGAYCNLPLGHDGSHREDATDRILSALTEGEARGREAGETDVECVAQLLYYLGVFPEQMTRAAAAQGQNTLDDVWTQWKDERGGPFAISERSKDEARKAARSFLQLVRLRATRSPSVGPPDLLLSVEELEALQAREREHTNAGVYVPLWRFAPAPSAPPAREMGPTDYWGKPLRERDSISAAPPSSTPAEPAEGTPLDLKAVAARVQRNLAEKNVGYEVVRPDGSAFLTYSLEDVGGKVADVRSLMYAPVGTPQGERDDGDDVALEVLCRVFDDVDEVMDEWRAFDKSGWMWWGRALGAFIRRRLNARASERETSRERELRYWNERVAVCARHTSDIVEREGCVICDLEAGGETGQLVEALANAAQQLEDAGNDLSGNARLSAKYQPALSAILLHHAKTARTALSRYAGTREPAPFALPVKVRRDVAWVILDANKGHVCFCENRERADWIGRAINAYAGPREGEAPPFALPMRVAWDELHEQWVMRDSRGFYVAGFVTNDSAKAQAVYVAHALNAYAGTGETTEDADTEEAP